MGVKKTKKLQKQKNTTNNLKYLWQFCKISGFISTVFLYSCATPPKPPQPPELNRGKRIMMIKIIKKITKGLPKLPPHPDTATLSSNDILHAPFSLKLISLNSQYILFTCIYKCYKNF
jgi:hypothetical protein